MEIYIGKDGQVLGPYREDEIRTRLDEGIYDGTELACHGDFDKWVKLQELGELNEKVKEEQSAHEVELKNLKVEHEMESRELQRTIEEERSTHGRAIAELNAGKSAGIAKLNADNRMLEETNCIMSQEAESLQAKIKEYEVALQSSPEETISFQQKKIQDLESQNKELAQKHQKASRQLVKLEAEQATAEVMREYQAARKAEEKSD
tara:strand:- start:456 stop:1073 length:618 start_codon:yes stop_codon:yes gene_type:complete